MGEPLKTSPSAADSSQSDCATPRYCRACNYNLHGLTVSRCPECGREFDPTNPKTYRSNPRRAWLRYVKRAAYAVAAVVLVFTLVWLWFFWGWYSERQALAAMSVDPTSEYIWYAPIVSSWPKDHLGPVGFVMDRVILYCKQPTLDIEDFTPLTRLKKLEALDLSSSRIHDLAPLAGLKELRTLRLADTTVTNLAPLANLTKLESLSLDGTLVTNLAPLAGLTKLESLQLYGAPVNDLVPLARLTNLKYLALSSTRVTDVAPLAGLKSLRLLTLPKETTTAEQANELQRDLPDCLIDRK